MKTNSLSSFILHPSTLLATLFLAALSFAQPQQSTNFRITKSVIDAGGTESSSANFRLYSAFGQPTPLGLQTSANFKLSAGYLSPMFLVSPLSPIQELVIKAEPTNIKLWWESVTNAQSYYIYRSTSSQMEPDSTSLIGSTSDTFYTDTGVTALPPIRHFYYVTSSRTALPPAFLARKIVPDQNTYSLPETKRKTEAIPKTKSK